MHVDPMFHKTAVTRPAGSNSVAVAMPRASVAVTGRPAVS